MSDERQHEAAKIDHLIGRLDGIYDMLGGYEKRFDKIDTRMDTLISTVNHQDKLILKHGLLIEQCQAGITSANGRIDKHLGDHASLDRETGKEKIKDAEEKSGIKLKVGILWGIGIFIATQIGLAFFVYLQIKGRP